jgi:hypothetical protein
MKTLLKFALMLSFVITAHASDKVVQVTPGLTLDRAVDGDSTHQELPDLGLGSGKFICLWDGDVLNACFLGVFDKFKGSLDDYIEHTKKVIERGGGVKELVFTRASRFNNEQGIEINRFDVSVTINEDHSKQYYYTIQTTTGFYSIIVSVPDVEKFEAIGLRADKLLKSAKLLKKQS